MCTNNQTAYTKMTTDELRALLHQDLWENTLDDASLAQITEELRTRCQKDEAFQEPRLDESWHRLQARLAAESAIWEPEPTRKNILHTKWLRTGVAMVAMLAIVLAATIPATADGASPLSYIATWTESDFWLSPVRDLSKDSIKYHELPVLLRRYGITEHLLPTWLPDRFAYEECEVNDDFFGGVLVHVWFRHMDTDEYIALTILDHTRETDMYAPKDDREVILYSVHDIQHYIFSYNNQLMANWVNNEIRCGLGGNISEEELKKMIDSIYRDTESTLN